MRVVNTETIDAIQTHSSFEAAIEATEQNPRAARGRDVTRLIHGATFESFSRGDTWLELLLSDGRVLSFHATDQLVDWQLFDDRSLRPTDTRYGGEMELRFRKTTVPWEPERLLLERAGKMPLHISPTDVWVFLGVSRLEELMLSRLRDTDTGQVFLYFDET